MTSQTLQVSTNEAPSSEIKALLWFLAAVILGTIFVATGAIMGFLAFFVEPEDEYISLAEYYGIPTQIMTLAFLGAGLVCFLLALILTAVYGCSVLFPNERKRRATMTTEHYLQERLNGTRKSTPSISVTNASAHIQLKKMQNVRNY